MPSFQSLPAELRLEIWELSMPSWCEPAVLPWHHAHDCGNDPPVICPQPSIFSVCQESRVVAEKDKKYAFTWAENSQGDKFDNLLMRQYMRQDAVYVAKSQFHWFRRHLLMLQKRNPGPEVRDYLRYNTILTDVSHLALDSRTLMENPTKVRLWFRTLPRFLLQLQKITIVFGKQWERPAQRPDELLGKGNKVKKSDKEYEAVSKEWAYKEIEPPMALEEVRGWSSDQTIRMCDDDPTSSRRLLDLYTELRCLMNSTKPYDDVTGESRWKLNDFIPVWDIELAFAKLVVKKWA
ncbi:hypothetical protein J7T55_002048 [Diaporthe amygdali]|uniref:uncharacterized protein n=1 Tax=Phomopsis amygdali TaxID=1214568 RepID=UPI0022FEADB8|nr:uncharacterized protein J7T55_002048 [Diaporthe amygdali]KAJ0108444.1 hypothetical protein J7T55_002048 [Diaporthe amygdali]